MYASLKVASKALPYLNTENKFQTDIKSNKPIHENSNALAIIYSTEDTC